MNQPGKKIGLWKPWKNKLRFPTVPTAPTAADNQDEKAAHQNKRRSFTQNPLRILTTWYLASH